MDLEQDLRLDNRRGWVIGLGVGQSHVLTV